MLLRIFTTQQFMENSQSFDLAKLYLNYLVWEHIYYFEGEDLTFQEIISNHYNEDVDYAINNFFICDFNNTHYYFNDWLQVHTYDFDEDVIEEAASIMMEVIFNRNDIEDFKELVGLGEIFLK